MQEFETVVEAVKRLDDDLALIEGIPVANTAAARQTIAAHRLAAHERFAAKIRASLPAEDEGHAPVAPPEPVVETAQGVEAAPEERRAVEPVADLP
jgi:hypothetical protein